MTQAECEGIYVLGARNATDGAILIANTLDVERELKLDVQGADINKALTIKTDQSTYYTVFDEAITDCTIKVLPYSMTEIRIKL